VNALLNPTDANWQLAQRYVRENANLLMHNMVVWYSDPTLALQFIAPPNQSRLTYKLEGNKKINGVQVYGVGFKEPKDGTPILDKVPGRAESSGRIWVDPATGGVHMTELWVQSQTDTVRVQVNFAPEAKLDMLLPRSATHSFEWREYGSTTASVGRAPMKLSFETSAEYRNATYRPIDLGRAGK